MCRGLFSLATQSGVVWHGPAWRLSRKSNALGGCAQVRVRVGDAGRAAGAGRGGPRAGAHAALLEAPLRRRPARGRLRQDRRAPRRLFAFIYSMHALRLPWACGYGIAITEATTDSCSLVAAARVQ